MESLLAKLSYIVPWSIGALVYIIRGNYTTKESFAIFLSGVSSSTFLAPAIIHYIGTESTQYISFVAFVFWLSGMVICGGIVDYIKNPEFFKEIIQKFIKK